MKEIQLTQGKVALVDDEDFERLSRYRWYARKDRNVFYAQRNSPMVNGIRQNMIHMHHEIISKPLNGFEIDHENGNGLDNQRHNLRFVTHRQNGQNRKNQKSSSRYPGVSWFKISKKWEANIQINGRKKHLGLFFNELDAFNAHKQAVEAIGETVI